MSVVAVGGLADLQDRDTATSAPSGDDRLAVVVRLFAELASGERLVADRNAMGIGLHRRGSSAIWKRYVGPPPLPSDPAELEQFLERYRVHRRDVQDAIDQLLGRDPDQHRPPRLSWQTLINRLAEDDIQMTEDQLIATPFRYEFSEPLRAELAD